MFDNLCVTYRCLAHFQLASKTFLISDKMDVPVTVPERGANKKNLN